MTDEVSRKVTINDVGNIGTAGYSSFLRDSYDHRIISVGVEIFMNLPLHGVISIDSPIRDDRPTFDD